jgi:nicotinamide-nucleotide amidase
MLTSIAGSSGYFWGGVISYDDRVKQKLLDVKPEDLAEFGAVSHQVAQQMASVVRASLNTSWGLSITGIAGPGGGTDAKPVGLVYIGLAGPNGDAHSFEYRFGDASGRDWIRNLSSCTALDRLRRQLLLTKG